MDEILVARNIQKSYGAVQALHDANLIVRRGEVHALCGDNGAGKSTLIKIISGVEQQTGGELLVKGQSVQFADPHAALASGIATIHQDLGLAPRLAIYQNIFMGAELERRALFLNVLDRSRMIADSKTYLSQINSDLDDMTVQVQNLSGGQRQAIAISRALRWQADIIIMDEPTAALGVRETEQVLQLIRKIRDNGVTVILISHNMADVVSVADSVTLLRAGRTHLSRPTEGLTAQELSRLIMQH